MGEIRGTALYHRGVEWAHANLDARGIDLHHKVNDPTPWIIDVNLGDSNSLEYRELYDWCDEQFGPQSWPIHGRPGNWYIAGATVFGRTHVGFATEEMMQRFMARFPNRIWPDAPPEGGEK